MNSLIQRELTTNENVKNEKDVFVEGEGCIDKMLKKKYLK